MQFELSRPTDYSDEAILQELKRVAEIVVEKPLTKTKFNQNSKYSASTIAKRFGTWNNALEKAGLDESYLYTSNIKISQEEIINELKRVSELIKSKSFTRKEFADNSTMTPYVFRGDNSFNKLMKLAELDVPMISRKYTDKECFENLLNVWTYYRRQPNYAEIKKEPSKVGPKAYITRWGSWTKALIAFIDIVNKDLSETNEQESQKEATISDKVSKPKTKQSVADGRNIPLGLRYDILRRDKFCCVLCGATPKTHNISLEVDHIIPWAKGGKTIRENLRTLCDPCNNGKSDKIE